MKKKLIISFFVFLISLQSSFAQSGQNFPDINWHNGPDKVKLGSNLAELKMPKGYLYADGDDARELLTYYGEPVSNQEIGVIVPNSETERWVVLFTYDPIGYVKDDDAGKIDSDKLLQTIKENTEAANNERIKLGSKPFQVLAWHKKPYYDPKTHNLIWSIVGREEGSSVKTINHNVRILGRKGVTSITLSSPEPDFVADKQNIDTIVTNYGYIQGQKYTDFIPGKDKVAEIGLAALILGGTVAAAKSGALAKIFVFLLVVFKKLWFVLAIAFFSTIGKLFGFIKNLFTGGQKKSEESLDVLVDMKSKLEQEEKELISSRK